MNIPPLGEISKELLDAERARADGDESADADALLARIRASIGARATSRSRRGLRAAFLLAAALVLVAVASLAAYRVTHPLPSPSSPTSVTTSAPKSEAAPSSVIPAMVPSAPDTTFGTAAGTTSATLRPHVAASASASPTSDAAVTEPEAAEEVALIARARAALAAGDTDPALHDLYLHERQFQHPKLSEEREILFVQALAAAHRPDEARKRFVRFEKAYPASSALSSLRRLFGDEPP